MRFRTSGTSVAVTAASFLNLLTSLVQATGGNDTTVGTLQSCLQSLTPVYPSSANYGKDSQPFNQRLPWKPAVIVYPSNAQEVSQAVKCAASAGYKVSARSGGHSYAAYGLGGEDGQVIISLDQLSYAYVDSSSQQAKIGGGTRLGNVALGLWNGGERAMPHGVCPYVGAGGHFAMGGWGLDSRLWGLALDHMVAMTVVKADGSISTISSTNEADLFWAMRGAGSSFAIVTEFVAETQAAPPEVYHVGLSLNLQNANQATQAFLAYVNWGISDAVPAGLGLQLNLGPGRFEIDATYYGSNAQSAMNQSLQSLLPNLPVQPTWSTWDDNYIGSVKRFTGHPDRSLNVTGTSESPDTFYVNALFVDQDNLLTQEAVQSFFDYSYNQGSKTSAKWYIQVDIWGGKSSAINQVGQDETSFWTRNSAYGFQIYASSQNYSPPYPQSDIEFVQGFTQSMTSKMPGVTFNAYPNYVDSELTASQAQPFYYGGHVQRLNQIKASVDPNGVFTNPQAFGRS